MRARPWKPEEYRILDAPYCQPVGEETAIFEAAYRNGLDEGAGTRLLVHAGKLMGSGIDPIIACRRAIAEVLTDDLEMLAAVNELSASLFSLPSSRPPVIHNADKQATFLNSKFKIHNSKIFSVVSPADDYALLDFGHGRRLERFGELLIDRPAPQAVKPPKQARWEADWVYTGAKIDSGHWQAKRSDLAKEWSLRVDGQTMQFRALAGGQVGLYPEHIACWRWLRGRLHGQPGAKVLNLFAASGGATLAAAIMGAEVDHVDAQSGALDLARRNLAGAFPSFGQGEGAPLADPRSTAALPKVRWLRDDAGSFVQRALRRGRTYDLVILDPPSYGRGPKGKTWSLARDLTPLLTQLAALLSDRPLGLWLSTHTKGWGPERLIGALRAAFPNTKVLAGELGVVSLDGRVLGSGHTAILNFLC